MSHATSHAISPALSAGDLCTRRTVVAEPAMALNEAARLMREEHVGCLVVTEDTLLGSMPLGILSDRDIVTAVVAKDIDARTLRVEDVMSTDLVTVRESESVLDALAAMRRHGVRRLPVIDDRGVLQGLLALDDVVELVGEQVGALAQALVQGGRREASRRR